MFSYLFLIVLYKQHLDEIVKYINVGLNSASMPVEAESETQERIYDQSEMGKRLGYGDVPCIIVIDLQEGETDPEHPMGSDLSDVIKHTNDLVDAAHENDVPVIWFRVVFEAPDARDGGTWLEKAPSMANWVEGSHWIELDDRLHVGDDDAVINKQHASCFFGTQLDNLLVSHGVDTPIITGCSTSACVRATVGDASARGYHVIVPEEAVGERSQDSHESHLWDIDQKFADVRPVDEVTEYLGRV